jgi:hypothetical protein
MTPPAAVGAAPRVRRSPAPRVPRRVSGPAPKPRLAPRPKPPGAIGRLADARALDAILHGRYWIPIVALGLLGIVFMQVSMLKLNAGIGRAVERTAVLERQNSLLRAEASRLDAGGRIEDLARGMGMLTPAADGYHYLTAGNPGDAPRAAAMISRPDPVAAGSTLVAPVIASSTPSTETPVTPAATGQATAAATASPPATAAAPATGVQPQAQPSTQQPATAAGAQP